VGFIHGDAKATGFGTGTVEKKGHLIMKVHGKRRRNDANRVQLQKGGEFPLPVARNNHVARVWLTTPLESYFPARVDRCPIFCSWRFPAMFVSALRKTALLALIASVSAGATSAMAGAAEPDYGDYRGPAPKHGQGTDGKSFRKNTYGQVGSGAVLPGSLGGSTATTPEGLMNSGSYGVTVPGSGIDVLHQDEMKRLRHYRAHKKAVQKAAKGGAKTAETDTHSTSATVAGYPPEVKILPTELRLAGDARISEAVVASKRSVVRDHAIAASPATPGQGGARRDRSVPSTSAGPRLAPFSSTTGGAAKEPEANVAGVAWGRPVSQPAVVEHKK
jgi:hypothetical protein